MRRLRKPGSTFTLLFASATLALVVFLVASCRIDPSCDDMLEPEPLATTSLSEAKPMISGIRASGPPPYLYNPQPFEALFMEHDYVVRASWASIRAGAEATTTGYRPVLRVRYSVHEWLRDSGPSEIDIVLRQEDPPAYLPGNPVPWFPVEGEAQECAERLVASRDRTHEGYQVVLLLDRDDGTSPHEYALRARTRRVWDYHTDREVMFLATSQGPVDEETTFATDSTAPVVSLDELRTRLRNLDDALAAAGQDRERYEECLGIRLTQQYVRPEKILDWPDLEAKIYEPCRPQSAPQNLRAEVSRTEVILAWDAPPVEAEVIDYLLERDGGNGWRGLAGVITEQQYIDDEVEPGKVYMYRIWPWDGGMFEGWPGRISEPLTVEMPE